MKTRIRAAEMLYVDDSPDDQMLALMALEATGRPHDLRVVDSALEMWTVLSDRVDDGLPLPDVLVIDLKMPRVNGHQLIEKLCADPLLRDIPVVVLSTSQDPRDIERASTAGAVRYESKPSSFVELADAFGRILDIAERR